MTIRLGNNIIAGGVGCTPPKTGATAPTTSTVADYVGQLYIDTATDLIYICEDITSGVYTWVNAVKAPYITITSTDTTYTLKNNSVYGHVLIASGVTYTLPTVNANQDNWCKLFIDTTNSASIAFSGTSPNPNGVANIVTGHKYIVVCQYNNLKTEWEIYIIDGGVVS